MVKSWLPIIAFALIALASVSIMVWALVRTEPEDTAEDMWPERVRLRCEYNLPDITPGFRVIDLECVVLSGDGS